jgi:ferredoxin-NADP reductase
MPLGRQPDCFAFVCGDRSVEGPAHKDPSCLSGHMDGIAGPRPGLPVPARYVLPLIASRRESPTSMTFQFSTDGTGFRYLSNQAIRLSLPGVEDPWGAVRTFSLSSSPSEEGTLAVTCKISDTPFKQALARLGPGETAQVYGPLGSFLFDGSRPCVFLAGGIGITPFRGMLKFAADTGVRSPMTLLYSARVPEELVFREELDGLTRFRPNIHVHYSVTRPGESPSPWNGRVGRIDRSWVEEAANLSTRPLFYVAGLPEMVEQMVEVLTGGLGVPSDDIDYELFRGF